MKQKAATPEAFELLMRGGIALARMESNGIRVDEEYLDRMMVQTAGEAKALGKKLTDDPIFTRWRRRFGPKANLGSLPQMGEVIFGEMGYPCPAKTATGRFSATEEAFDEVDLPFVRDHVKMRKLGHLLGTYLKNLKRELVNGYLHPGFNLHTTTTYRSSSSGGDRATGGKGSFNFQNIPVRNPAMAGVLRPCFIPRKGRRLVETDLAGAEVRVSCCYNKDPQLIKYIEDPTTDMHRDNAERLFLLKREEVFKGTTRDAAKNMWTFPQFYGSCYFQCAPPIWKAMKQRDFRVGEKGISLREHLASRGITSLGECSSKQRPVPGTLEYHFKKEEDFLWNERFPVYSQWKKDWWAAYLKQGGYRTLTGFYIKWTKEGILGRNDCSNAGIQGSAFHMLLWCHVKIQEWLDKKAMRTKLVGTIHDSLIADVPDNELQDYLTYTHKVFTILLPRAWKWIIVPIEIEHEISPPRSEGGSWHLKRQWVQKNDIWAEKQK